MSTDSPDWNDPFKYRTFAIVVATSNRDAAQHIVQDALENRGVTSHDERKILSVDSFRTASEVTVALDTRLMRELCKLSEERLEVENIEEVSVEVQA